MERTPWQKWRRRFVRRIYHEEVVGFSGSLESGFTEEVMKVTKTRVFDAVRGGARPIPAGDELGLLPITDEDDDGTDLHRLARGEIAPFQRTHVAKSRVTAPAESPSAGD
jgi:hypothetical protein